MHWSNVPANCSLCSFVRIVVLAIPATFLSAPAYSQVPKQTYADDGHMVVWRIDKPEVLEPTRTYPEIQFRKYDEVIVHGGGCVDTGGILPSINRTWKRYIDPSGANSDRLYHGRISIPGATAGLVRISSIEGLHLMVNKFPAHNDDGSPYVLTLGYEDDEGHYKDNRYDTTHDNGTGKQCALERDPGTDGLAWLEITIKHHDSPFAVLPRNPVPRAPVDLWWEAVDENHLPLNPDWWMHQSPDPLTNAAPSFPNSNEKTLTRGCDGFREGPHDFLKLGRSPKCTMWDPDVDEASLRQLPCHFGGLPSNTIHGHANWAAVTYVGNIYFDIANNGSSNESFLEEKHFLVEDGDYDWLFVTDGQRGLSAGSVVDSARAQKEGRLPEDTLALALEFSSRETIDHFVGSDWWTKFHSLVDHQPNEARKMVAGKPAVVTGLIGFDNEHGAKGSGARVELHPVWGLAIHVAEASATSNEDVWAIFARNWGNEGFCSNGFDKTGGTWQHYLPLRGNKMTFFLPMAITKAAQITPEFYSDYGDGNSKASASVVDGGVLLTIQLANPQDRKLFWGELHVKR